MNDEMNNRSEPRFLSEIAVFIESQASPDDNGEKNMCVTKTLDISAHGIKVLVDFPCPLNSFHQLCIDTPGERFFLVGKVAWVTRIDDAFAMGFVLMESDKTHIAQWQAYVEQWVGGCEGKQ